MSKQVEVPAGVVGAAATAILTEAWGRSRLDDAGAGMPHTLYGDPMPAERGHAEKTAQVALEAVLPSLYKHFCDQLLSDVVEEVREQLLPVIEEALARLDDEEQYRYMRKIERRLDNLGAAPGGERCEACEAPATKGPYLPDALYFCDECDAALQAASIPETNSSEEDR